MLKKFLFNKLLILFLLCSFQNLNALENKILFKVNNEIITSIDIFKQIVYLKATNPSIENLSENEIFEIAKNSIIREKVKEIGILQIVDELDIDQNFLEKILFDRYKKIGLNSLNEFENYLNLRNLELGEIKKKITVELIWNDIIYQKYKSKIKIDKQKIKDEILSVSKQKLRKLSLSELFFNVSKDNEFDLKYKQILLDIKNQGFKNAVLLHSISNSASMGGSLGWINENSLSNQVKEKISKLAVGQYSEPISTPGGFVILKIDDEEYYEVQIDLDKEINDLVKFKTNQQLNQFSNIYFNKVKKDIIINEL